MLERRQAKSSFRPSSWQSVFPQRLCLAKALSVFLLILLTPATVYASDIIQVLNREHSSFKFSVASDWFDVSGRVERFKAEVSIAAADSVVKSVDLEIDFSSLVLDASEAGAIHFQTLLQRIPGRTGHFKSTEVKPRGKAGLIVFGKFSRGSSEWKMVLPVQIISLTKQKSVFRILYGGPFDSGDLGSPLPIYPPNSRGRVLANLVFQSVPAKQAPNINKKPR